jgi:hypothetical protein
LRDPGLPDSDLNQIGYSLFTACGLTLMLFGPGSLEDCFAAVSKAAPVFLDTRALGTGVGTLGNRDDGYWMGYEGPLGAAVAYFCLLECDLHYVRINIMDPLKDIGGIWAFDLGSVGAEVPSEAWAILAEARAVPVWAINALGSIGPE